MASVVQVGVASSQSKARTLEDAKRRELIAGASGVTNPTGLNPRILNALAGTKFKIVTGYKGTSEAAHRLGARRGRRGDHELGRDHRTLRRPVPRRGDPSALHLRHDAAAGARRAFRRSPSSAATTPRRRSCRSIPSAPRSAARFAFPPGVPAHRVALWRAAFQTMLDDPEFKRTIAKGNIRARSARRRDAGGERRQGGRTAEGHDRPGGGVLRAAAGRGAVTDSMPVARATSPRPSHRLCPRRRCQPRAVNVPQAQAVAHPQYLRLRIRAAGEAHRLPRI